MKQRGDTIVEVLFAVTVFSVIAVGGLSLMNQGTAMAQRSLEIGLVRDQIDAQADALRYVHDAYIANYSGATGTATTDTVWHQVSEQHAVTGAQSFADMADARQCHLPAVGNMSTGRSDGEPFALDIRKLDGDNGTPVMLFTRSQDGDQGMPISREVANDYIPTYAQVRYPPEVSESQAEGIWVQAVFSPRNGSTPGYYDFHIRACWQTPGQLTPVTLGTIVRLYDPAA